MLNNNLFLLVLISVSFYSLASIKMNIYIKVLILLSIICLLSQNGISENYTKSTLVIDKKSDIYQEDPGCHPNNKVMERDMDLRDSHLYVNKNRAKRPATEMGDVLCKWKSDESRSRGQYNHRYIPRDYKKWCLKTCKTGLNEDGIPECI